MGIEKGKRWGRCLHGTLRRTTIEKKTSATRTNGARYLEYL